MEVITLGTSAMLPTKERNPSAVFISYKNEGILIDCGEGTQRQMKLAGIPLHKITKILLTHWHGDHVLGLLGLIQSLGASEYSKVLEIYSPKGTKKFFDKMQESIVFDFRVEHKFIEIADEVFFKGKDFSLECASLDHRTPCIAYSFKENDVRKMDVSLLKKCKVPLGPLVGDLQEGKTIIIDGKKITPEMVGEIKVGRKIVLITDTALTKSCYSIAKDADLLVCEASYTSELEDKAREYKHLTAKDAALIASKSNVKKLVLTHFSARYKNTSEVESDARTYFDNVFCAKDLMRFKL